MSKDQLIESGSSNLLVDKIKSMAALRIAVFWFALEDYLPESKIFVGRESVFTNSLVSTFLLILFWDFVMGQEWVRIFISSQVKWSVIISN